MYGYICLCWKLSLCSPYLSWRRWWDESSELKWRLPECPFLQESTLVIYHFPHLFLGRRFSGKQNSQPAFKSCIKRGVLSIYRMNLQPWAISQCFVCRFNKRLRHRKSIFLVSSDIYVFYIALCRIWRRVVHLSFEGGGKSLKNNWGSKPVSFQSQKLTADSRSWTWHWALPTWVFDSC
jgi:hypothetical protein